MRAERAQAAVSRDAIAGVEGLAAFLVGAMDNECMEVILRQSAGFLEIGAAGAVSAAISRLLRTPHGVSLIDDIMGQIQGALDLCLVDCLAAAFSARICSEIGIETERDPVYPERLVIAAAPTPA